MSTQEPSNADLLAAILTMGTRIDALAVSIAGRLDAMHARLDGVHTRIDTVIDGIADIRRDLSDLRHEYENHGHPGDET